jgi:hypothetical protein
VNVLPEPVMVVVIVESQIVNVDVKFVALRYEDVRAVWRRYVPGVMVRVLEGLRSKIKGFVGG